MIGYVGSGANFVSLLGRANGDPSSVALVAGEDLIYELRDKYKVPCWASAMPRAVALRGDLTQAELKIAWDASGADLVVSPAPAECAGHCHDPVD